MCPELPPCRLPAHSEPALHASHTSQRARGCWLSLSCWFVNRRGRGREGEGAHRVGNSRSGSCARLSAARTPREGVVTQEAAWTPARPGPSRMAATFPQPTVCGEGSASGRNLDVQTLSHPLPPLRLFPVSETARTVWCLDASVRITPLTGWPSVAYGLGLTA